MAVLLLPVALSAGTALQDRVAAMQPGWNLGNSLDAIPDETSWGNPPVTQAFIQQVAAQGFKSIRIPVTWSRHLGPGPAHLVDAAWMDRVQQVVDWSLQAGLVVLLNAHHDSWEWASALATDHDAVLAKYRAVWGQVAARFRDYPATLMFESLNEPFFAGVSDAAELRLLDELNTAFVRLVRGSGGMNALRPLVLPTLATGSTQAYLDSLNATIAQLNDPGIVATVHYYGYWPFSVNIAGSTRFDAAAQADVIQTFGAVASAFGSRNIPVIIGEYGLLAFDNEIGAIQQGEMLKFFESVTYQAGVHGMTHMLWDNGQHFNRATYTWRDPEMFAVILRSLTGRSATASSDQIWLLSDRGVADTVLTLNLNGNALVSLHDGVAPLTAGVDYTLVDSTLTVKAAALARYATGSYGEKAVLTAHFQAGPPWKIRVRFSAPPVLGPSTLAAAALAIPAAFQGDQLATMQAVYEAGGNAGPQNWTAYKEFTVAFAPDYANNRITVTPKFFAETVAGRAILFTFHFWSGRTVSYRYAEGTGAVVAAAGSSDTAAPAPSNSAGSTSATPAASSSSGGGGAPSLWLLMALALLALVRCSRERRLSARAG